MTSVSVLFARHEDQVAAQRAIKPLFVKDLNIDQIVNSITVDRSEYALEPFFSHPLTQIDSILYRQEVFKDLEHAPLLEQVRLFGRAMREVRATLNQSAKGYYRHHKQAWFLDAVRSIAMPSAASRPICRRLQSSRAAFGALANISSAMYRARASSCWRRKRMRSVPIPQKWIIAC